MKKLVEDILKGYHRNITKNVINVDIQEESEDKKDSMVEESPMLIIGTRTVKSAKDFFEDVYSSFSDYYVDFAYSDDKSFKIRRSEYDIYVEDVYVFSKKALADKRVQTELDKFVTRAKQRYPYAEQTEKEITYAQALAKIAYDKKYDISFSEIEDIPGFQEFYNKNKAEVEKRLYRILKDKPFFYATDFTIRVLVLIIINILFFLNIHGVALLALDVLFAGVIGYIDGVLVKEGIKSKLEKDVAIDMEHKRENLLWLGLNAAGTKDYNEPIYTNNNVGEEISFRNRVLKAIRADIRIIDQMKYPGYQEDLASLYELAGMLIKAIAGEKATTEELDGIKEVLVRLIDVERTLTMRLNFYGTLNAEKLLHQVEPSYVIDDKEVMFDMEDRSKKLEY